MKKRNLLFVFISVAFVIASCQPSIDSSGDPDQGAQMFNSSQIGDAPGCATCHSIVPGEIIVGPSLAGVASKDSNQLDYSTAEEYVLQSILEPNAYIVEGFSPNIMYQDFSSALTEKELQDLTAYLMTLSQ